MGYYLEVFGPDRFFIELQDHDIPQLVTVNNTLIEFAQAVQPAFPGDQRRALHLARRGCAPRRSALHPDQCHRATAKPDAPL
jgi:hypothetical protein